MKTSSEWDSPWAQFAEAQAASARRHNELGNQLCVAFRDAQEEAYETWCAWEEEAEYVRQYRNRLNPLGTSIEDESVVPGLVLPSMIDRLVEGVLDEFTPLGRLVRAARLEKEYETELRTSLLAHVPTVVDMDSRMSADDLWDTLLRIALSLHEKGEHGRSLRDLLANAVSTEVEEAASAITERMPDSATDEVIELSVEDIEFIEELLDQESDDAPRTASVGELLRPLRDDSASANQPLRRIATVESELALRAHLAAKRKLEAALVRRRDEHRQRRIAGKLVSQAFDPGTHEPDVMSEEELRIEKLIRLLKSRAG